MNTRIIAEQMADDEWWDVICAEAEAEGVDPREVIARRPEHDRMAKECARVTLATPKETDVGQCWSEEIFSMLEGER